MKKTNFLKRISLLICILAVANQFGQAQTTGIYIPNTSYIFIPSGASAGFWGDTLQLDGYLNMEDSSSLIYFKGKVWNNSATATISSGRVIMNDTASQTINGGGFYSGAGVSFARLEINNPAGVSLGNGNVRIDSLIVFTRGVLTANNNDILLGKTAIVSQTDPTSFASVEHGGGLSKFFTSNTAFVFPVGCNNVAAIYNPLKLDLNASGYNPTSYVRVSMTDSIHIQKTPRHVNYEEKYWTVKFHNLTADSSAYTASYNAADVFQGDTSKVTGSVWANGKWSYLSSGRISGAALAVTGKITSDADIFGQDKLVQANMKVILQGAWNGTQMNTTLRNNDLIPLSQPYGTAPFNGAAFNYLGTEHRTALPANAVDWVLLELRSTANGPAVARSVGLLLSDGTIKDGFIDGPTEFAGVAEGNYYLVIKHRNHIAVMSAVPISLPNTNVYDFTTAMSQSFGSASPMATLGAGKYGMYGGNVIPDASVRANGLVVINDYNRILSILGNYTTPLVNVYSSGDVNMDGSVRASGLPATNDQNKILTYLGSLTTVLFQGF